jgi:predicted ribonuclease toxin of YeeF-YezG toxin-antitoxin module
LNYHIILEKCEYSVPFKYLKEQMELRYSSNNVRIYFKNELIAVHPRLRRAGDASTLNEHMPKDHQYVANKTNPNRLRAWAKSIGEQSTLFVEDAFGAVEHKPNAFRKIVAVLSLAKRFSFSSKASWERERVMASTSVMPESMKKTRTNTSFCMYGRRRKIL